MTDIPQNLEDGELWLPSDVFDEIVSSNDIRANLSPKIHNNGPSEITHVPNIQPLPSSSSILKSNSSTPKYSKENCNGLDGESAGATSCGAAPLGQPKTVAPRKFQPKTIAPRKWVAPFQHFQPPQPVASVCYIQSWVFFAPFPYFQNPNFPNNGSPMLQQQPFPIQWPSYPGMMSNNFDIIQYFGTGVYFPFSHAAVAYPPTYNNSPPPPPPSGGKTNKRNRKKNVNNNSVDGKGKNPA
ncbi:hypothetical protein F8388_002474 [Cannabis sativa]|uniref:Uncharacterized protein n=1 Tax=Cannabis sativa TaxID=3483 RepID=A0A7J6I2E9_CANSA|nr:hypothetical protein F8388_002474 [Cannabis sativa]KAF4401211.1 hypothetical protein G4B88_014052 [Cannabis sativa]